MILDEKGLSGKFNPRVEEACESELREGRVWRDPSWYVESWLMGVYRGMYVESYDKLPANPIHSSSLGDWLWGPPIYGGILGYKSPSARTITRSIVLIH